MLIELIIAGDPFFINANCLVLIDVFNDIENDKRKTMEIRINTGDEEDLCYYTDDPGEIMDNLETLREVVTRGRWE